MLNYHPPSGGRGISLGLVRQYRCAYGAPSSGVGTPTPRSIALVLQKPSIRFIASRCVRSLRLLSVSGLLACSGSHLSAAPFAFVPRLLEPPSALQLPPPAVSISPPLYWYIVANPLARAGLGPAFPSEIPRPSGRHLFYACACLGQAHGSATLRAAARRLYIAFHVRFSASLHSNSNARVLDCFSRFPDLLDFSFLFQCREIPRCCRARDMQEFLHLVVGDFAFCCQRFQNLVQFLSFPVLNRCSRFHEQIARGVCGLR